MSERSLRLTDASPPLMLLLFRVVLLLIKCLTYYEDGRVVGLLDRDGDCCINDQPVVA